MPMASDWSNPSAFQHMLEIVKMQLSISQSYLLGSPHRRHFQRSSGGHGRAPEHAAPRHIICKIIVLSSQRKPSMLVRKSLVNLDDVCFPSHAPPFNFVATTARRLHIPIGRTVMTFPKVGDQWDIFERIGILAVNGIVSQLQHLVAES